MSATASKQAGIGMSSVRQGLRIGGWLGVLAALVLAPIGFVIAARPYPTTYGGWLGWIGVAMAVGVLARRPRRVWIVWVAMAAIAAVAPTMGWDRDLRVFWWLSAAMAVVAGTLGFLAGTLVGGRRTPAAALRHRWSAIGRAGRRLTTGVVVLVVVVFAGYSAYAFSIGYTDYVAQAPNAAPCDNPGQRNGWAFEPINYDGSGQSTALDPTARTRNCTNLGPPAGGAVVSSDGIPIAGWYVPAASGAGPTGPTVVLVHGGQAHKTDMLRYATPFHADYNLVFLDLRNAGQSGGEMSSSGLYEQRDLRAVIDWLERTKAPSWIAVMGNSNGAATALAEALGDPRVRALILDSMHSTVELQLGNVIEGENYRPPWPASIALIAGASVHLGGDLASVDPIRLLPEARDRPILLTHGGLDDIDRPSESVERNLAAAIDAGVDVHFHLCAGAGHGEVVDVCAVDWGIWVTTFLAAARGV